LKRQRHYESVARKAKWSYFITRSLSIYVARGTDGYHEQCLGYPESKS